MESTEFDATLGGSENLPHIANSFKFAASRSIEIAAMTESIGRPAKTKLIFQSLPVHMRRRVMSHNGKRLPRRLREAHLEQLKKCCAALKQKRPSRKYRRRPANLLEEYTRRQRRIVWLETHIWHAKRFHMVERWGYRLAHRPCDKAFRACYRATSAHCLLQDISYYIPIQITGLIEDIEELFSYITDKSCGLSISAKAYISGNRAGCINIFQPHSYPYDYVGKVEFFWVRENSQRNLIIFVHPSQVKEVESMLINIINGSTAAIASNDNKRVKLTNELSNVKLQLMYGHINRFRLTGPKSHAVLTHSLKCVTDMSKIESNEWVSLLNKHNINLELEDKSNYWSHIRNLSSPSQLPSRIVIGLVVKDPRWSRPQKRTKAQITDVCNIQYDNLINTPSFASSSPLWDKNICSIVKKNAITNCQFIKHVTKTHVIPGEVNEDDPALQSIPVVMIQQSGSQNPACKKVGFGSGWDIIMPSGYSIPFWLTFVMFGARTGGLRETENLAHEMGKCYFSPDSNSGRGEEKRIETQLKQQYFNRPASKRVNFIKLGISNPFSYTWDILSKDWSSVACEKLFVLRDRNILNELQVSVKKKKVIPKLQSLNTDSCLVAIYLQIEGKGVVRDHALICLPNVEDIVSTLCEPQHEDTNAKIRKEKRLEHKKILKQLKRKRQKLRKKSDFKKEKQTKQNEPTEYVKSMRELWVPSNVKSVRYSCIRQTMGYVTKGAFSFTEAKGCAIGYITFNALACLLEQRINKVLIRNTTSRKYRVANFQIINNP